MNRVIPFLLATMLLPACREEVATVPDPTPLTEEALSYFCQMNVLDHGGPKAQIHVDIYEAPMFFAQVRDGIAYLRSPERDGRITAIYVSDTGSAADWDVPQSLPWITAEDAVFVIGSDRPGGMGAPELVPFASEADAAAFIADHGGQAVALDAIPDDAVTGPVDPDWTKEQGS
ncbi:nitrous oxide reductase accessory protein NosL [Palleronia caenipelagi]|uniref:Copper resistance protein CopZ n=1 Tax=Palleronia caenipelagi TaxID=2489174 RepID=A0A547QA07_9RHOB|nr:nitrous oxide reductase accessory protein NosL [Palleronia caenipelagi]TRD23225.1 copper resistance protein CopZ [Palleronia caenipelagi]